MDKNDSQLMFDDESQEQKPNFRGIPDVAYLLAVLKRNFFISLLIIGVYSPFALIYVARQSNEYTSGVMLKYDGSDALDIDSPPHAAFPASVLALASPTTGSDFFLELSKIYSPSVEPSRFLQIPFIGKILNNLIDISDKKNSSEERLDPHTLSQSVSLTSEFEQRVANVGLLTASESSPERARLLALTAANLIIDRYYRLQTSRLEAITKTLSTVLEKDQVKEMVERAVSNALQDDRTKAGKAAQEAVLTLRARQQSVQDRMKELNLRIQEDRERRLKIESEISTLAQRYGAYHPQIKALQSQLKEINSSNQSKQMSVELGKLQDQSLNYDAEAAALGLGIDDAPLESVDRIVKRLTTKRDRYSLELMSLQQQNSEPDNRVRLQMIGTPSLPLQPSRSVITKAAIFSAAFGIGLIALVVIIREFFLAKASEAWRISWLLNKPCLAVFFRKKIRNLARLDSETIRDLRTQLFNNGKISKRAQVLVEYRQLTHWLHNKTRGSVVFFAKTSEPSSCEEFIGNIANIYACDYPGRYLLIDFDGKNLIEKSFSGGHTIIDFLSRKNSWKEVCLPRNGHRMFDLLVGPPPIDRRTSEILGSTALADMIKSALKIYKKIFVIGFGPEHFVENSAILQCSSDCFLITEDKQTTFKSLRKQMQYFDADKVNGYVHIVG